MQDPRFNDQDELLQVIFEAGSGEDQNPGPTFTELDRFFSGLAKVAGRYLEDADQPLRGNLRLRLVGAAPGSLVIWVQLVAVVGGAIKFIVDAPTALANLAKGFQRLARGDQSALTVPPDSKLPAGTIREINADVFNGLSAMNDSVQKIGTIIIRHRDTTVELRNIHFRGIHDTRKKVLDPTSVSEGIDPSVSEAVDPDARDDDETL